MYFVFYTFTVVFINLKNTFLDWFEQFWLMYYLETSRYPRNFRDNGICVCVRAFIFVQFDCENHISFDYISK